ncbi:MAG: Bro-N domain-containing protein [Chloroherpetonaceae bacterium]|nr:Bro-N domain-containing protein [Chloroherpetonaceae bacterium]
MNNTSVSFLPFGDKSVRYHIDEHNQTWFVAKDVCSALDITWGGDILSQIKQDWKRGCEIITPGGVQKTWHISEQAVYKLAFRSRKPEAERFTDVVAEVVASIRKRNLTPTLSNSASAIGSLGEGVIMAKPKHNRLTPERMLDIMSDVCLIRDTALRTRIASKLMGGAR